MKRWRLFLGQALLLGGTLGVFNWTNNGWASVAYFCTCYLFIFGIGEMHETLIEFHNKLDRMLSNVEKT